MIARGPRLQMSRVREERQRRVGRRQVPLRSSGTGRQRSFRRAIGQCGVRAMLLVGALRVTVPPLRQKAHPNRPVSGPLPGFARELVDEKRGRYRPALTETESSWRAWPRSVPVAIGKRPSIFQGPLVPVTCHGGITPVPNMHTGRAWRKQAARSRRFGSMVVPLAGIPTFDTARTSIDAARLREADAATTRASFCVSSYDRTRRAGRWLPPADCCRRCRGMLDTGSGSLSTSHTADGR